MNHYDFIIIGGGSAGYAAARTFSEHGGRVAVIDGGDELSGLCILRGCMPSKTLIYSAETLHLARQGSVFGFDSIDLKADMSAMQKRKRKSSLSLPITERGSWRMVDLLFSVRKQNSWMKIASSLMMVPFLKLINM